MNQAGRDREQAAADAHKARPKLQEARAALERALDVAEEVNAAPKWMETRVAERGLTTQFKEREDRAKASQAKAAAMVATVGVGEVPQKQRQRGE